MSIRKERKNKEILIKEKMKKFVTSFESEFYNEFGFNPIVIYEDMNSNKIKGLIRERHNITLQDLEDICNSFLDLNLYPGGIRNRCRKHELCLMRQLYMHFGYKFDFTINNIAHQIGYNHAMVVHSNQVVSDRIDVNDKPYIKKYMEVRDAIEKKTGPTSFL